MRLLKAQRDDTLDTRYAWIEAQRRKQRWRALIERVELSVGPLQPHDGLWPDELAFLTEEVGLHLAPHIQTFCALFGRNFRLNAEHYSIISPFSWTRRRLYLIATNIQDEVGWCIWEGDKRANPKVYCYTPLEGHTRADELIKARAVRHDDEMFFTGHTFSSFWTRYT